MSELLDVGSLRDEIDHRYRVRRIAGSNSSWVAEADGQVIGSISLAPAGKDTGRLEQFRVAPEWEADRRLARRLVRSAADFAREQGVLKLVVDVPEELPGLPREEGRSPTARAAEAEARVKAYVELLGFVFSRERAIDRHTALEFLLDLYRHPRIEAEASA